MSTVALAQQLFAIAWIETQCIKNLESLHDLVAYLRATCDFSSMEACI